MKNFLYLAWLHSLWFTNAKFFSLFESKQNYKEVYENLSNSFLKKHNFTEKQINSILEKKDKINLEYLKNTLEKRSVEIIDYHNKNYPKNLKQIPNKPFLFYLRWELPKLNCLSVVWSRKITPYGINVIEKIIPSLASKFCIVSGGATWCDSEAHKASLKSNWKTLSVIWTGIDLDYPVSWKTLYDSIAENWWWVISIFPIWTPWNPFNFPIRNEIVAGISVWTLIVEAEEKSWSLITWKLALELWKDLFAIPWEIFNPRSVWCNNLISAWEAKLVNKPEDILLEYWFSLEDNKAEKSISFTDKVEEEIYNLLSIWALWVDDIIKKLKLDLWLINLKLSLLELNWILKKTTTGKYKLV